MSTVFETPLHIKPAPGRWLWLWSGLAGLVAVGALLFAASVQPAPDPWLAVAVVLALVVLWFVMTRRFIARAARVSSLVFSPDGRVFAEHDNQLIALNGGVLWHQCGGWVLLGMQIGARRPRHRISVPVRLADLDWAHRQRLLWQLHHG